MPRWMQTQQAAQPAHLNPCIRTSDPRREVLEGIGGSGVSFQQVDEAQGVSIPEKEEWEGKGTLCDVHCEYLHARTTAACSRRGR